MHFFEKKRRKAGGGLGWFTGGAKGDEEVCWERWTLEVTLATPKSETGMLSAHSSQYGRLIFTFHFRTDQVRQSYWIVFTEDCYEGPTDRQQRKRPYSTNNDQRSKSIPLYGRAQSKSRGMGKSRCWDVLKKEFGEVGRAEYDDWMGYLSNITGNVEDIVNIGSGSEQPADEPFWNNNSKSTTS